MLIFYNTLLKVDYDINYDFQNIYTNIKNYVSENGN